MAQEIVEQTIDKSPIGGLRRIYYQVRAPLHKLFLETNLPLKLVEVNCRGLTASFLPNSLRMKRYLENFGNEKEFLTEFLDVILTKNSNNFYDVGAFVGLWSILAAQSRKCQITSFEPHPKAMKIFSKNIELNKSGEVIKPVQMAISNTQSKQILFSPEKVWGVSSLIQRGKLTRQIPVEIGTIDNIRKSHGLASPTIAKIDVEGAEKRVLEGMKETLRGAGLRHIFMEIHPHLLPLFNTSSAEVYQILDSAGFKINSKRAGIRTILCHFSRE